MASSAVKNYDCIFDEGWLTMLLDNSLLWNEQVQLKFRHVASRFITRINQQNLEHCTRLMKYVELRHIDNVTGYLGIKDLTEQFIYVSMGFENITNEPTKLIDSESDIIMSVNRSFIQMQSYFFERVWSVATPAIQKIAEIERAASQPKVPNELMNNPSEICAAVPEIVEASRSEILVVFPYANTFWCAENAGVIAILGNKIKHNVVVKAIVHIGREEGDAEIIKERIKDTLKSKNNDLYANIYFSTRDLRDRNMFFIIDQVALLSAEIIDSTKKRLQRYWVKLRSPIKKRGSLLRFLYLIRCGSNLNLISKVMRSRPILIYLKDSGCDKKNTGESGFSSKRGLGNLANH